MFQQVLILCLFASSNALVDYTKIIGGNNATITDFPYQLSLQSRGAHICGASIVARQYALTAGSCFQSESDEYELRSGTDNLEEGNLHPVTKIYIHPKYLVFTGDYDVALVFTYEPFEFNEVRQPILITESEPDFGNSVIVSGWGSTAEDDLHSTKYLQAVDLPLIEQDMCVQLYLNIRDLTPRMFCGGVEGLGGCRYDEGNPVVQNGTQVGVASWWVGCGRLFLPSVFTNLALPEIRDWIREISWA